MTRLFPADYVGQLMEGRCLWHMQHFNRTPRSYFALGRICRGHRRSYRDADTGRCSVVTAKPPRDMDTVNKGDMCLCAPWELEKRKRREGGGAPKIWQLECRAGRAENRNPRTSFNADRWPQCDICLRPVKANTNLVAAKMRPSICTARSVAAIKCHTIEEPSLKISRMYRREV